MIDVFVFCHRSSRPKAARSGIHAPHAHAPPARVLHAVVKMVISVGVYDYKLLPSKEKTRLFQLVWSVERL